MPCRHYLDTIRRETEIKLLIAYQFTLICSLSHIHVDSECYDVNCSKDLTFPGLLCYLQRAEAPLDVLQTFRVALWLRL